MTIQQSHGGSGKQARAVIEGLEAVVVTLALAYDIDAIAREGRPAAGGLASGCPTTVARTRRRSCSSSARAIRRGFTTGPDLVKPGVSVITPNPKTSGGARWNYLAAWGYVLQRELGDLKKLDDPKQAERWPKPGEGQGVRRRAVQPRAGARLGRPRRDDRPLRSSDKGDVLLAWENEAFWRSRRSGADKFEIVVPSVSILAEPPVAVVDKVVDKQGTRAVAEAYVKYLYSPEGQAIAAKNFYRPIDRKAIAGGRGPVKPS